MSKKGISQIKIPVKQKDLDENVFESYLPYIFNKFVENSTKIELDYNKYCLDHKILTKTRAHDDSDINNQVLIPDLKAMVDWKTGYVCGNPIKYAQSKSASTDDITMLNKYIRNVCKRAVDKEVAKWSYATGVGYYFIEPKSEDFDINNEAPFEVFCREAHTCTKVYSAFNGNKPLADILYTTYEKVLEEGKNVEISVLDVYFPNKLITYEKGEFGSKWKKVNEQERGLYKFLPLVEKRWNTDGIGIVAMGESMQNALDQIMSDSLDNVSDVVNEVWVYYNILLGETAEEQAEAHRNAKKGGAIQAIANNKELQPKVETISTKLSLAEVQSLFLTINEKFHSSIGVPMEMSNTNSGGTTKQGSEVANGYDNAYNRALDDINTFLIADTQLLERIMWICQNTPNNKIDNLSSGDIEIKYSLNLTDNILTKTQAYVYLIQSNVPPAMALRLCRLSNDAEAEGKIIEEYQKNKQKQGTNSQE